jgi:hypothetical protein
VHVPPRPADGEDTLQRCRRVHGHTHPISRYLAQTSNTSLGISIDTSTYQPTSAGGAAADGPERPL